MGMTKAAHKVRCLRRCLCLLTNDAVYFVLVFVVVIDFVLLTVLTEGARVAHMTFAECAHVADLTCAVSAARQRVHCGIGETALCVEITKLINVASASGIFVVNIIVYICMLIIAVAVRYFCFCILLTVARRLRAERSYLFAVLSRSVGWTVTVVAARCVEAAALQARRGCAVIFGLLRVRVDNYFFLML